MRTQSNRMKFREQVSRETIAQGMKFKIIYKMIQVPIATALNGVLFYFISFNVDFDMFLERILVIFLITIASVMISHLIAIIVVRGFMRYKNMKKILTKTGSYKKFFVVTIIYSFLMSVIFSFGIFTMIYGFVGYDSITVFGIVYLATFIAVELFSYGLVSWVMDAVAYKKRVKLA